MRKGRRRKERDSFAASWLSSPACGRYFLCWLHSSRVVQNGFCVVCPAEMRGARRSALGVAATLQSVLHFIIDQVLLSLRRLVSHGPVSSILLVYDSCYSVHVCIEDFARRLTHFQLSSRTPGRILLSRSVKSQVVLAVTSCFISDLLPLFPFCPLCPSHSIMSTCVWLLAPPSDWSHLCPLTFEYK